MISLMLALLVAITGSTSAMEDKEKRASLYTELSELIPASEQHVENRLTINNNNNDTSSIVTQKKPKRKKKYCSKKSLGCLVATLLAINQLSSGMTLKGLSDINESASPMTAYPLVNGSYPIIPQRFGCNYTHYDNVNPPFYGKGECTCIRGSRCQCLIEECQGWNEYRTGYTTAFGFAILGISVTVLIGVVSCLNICINEFLP